MIKKFFDSSSLLSSAPGNEEDIYLFEFSWSLETSLISSKIMLLIFSFLMF